MLAISHAATALLLKRCYPETPMPWVLFAVELPAIVWLLLRFAGVEDASGYMPYSHSLATLLALACALWLLFGALFRRRSMAAAGVAGILAHFTLDLVLHAQPLALAPFLSPVHVGLSLSTVPPVAIAVALGYGVLCWLVFRGGKALLAAILLLSVAQLTFPVPPGIDIAVAMAVVWYLSRARAAELEHPDRRLARAFA
jgi:hypothetical protein